MTRFSTAIAIAALATSVACSEDAPADAPSENSMALSDASVSPAAAAALAGLGFRAPGDVPEVGPVDMPSVDCSDPADADQAGICDLLPDLDKADRACPTRTPGVTLTPQFEAVLDGCEAYSALEKVQYEFVLYRSTSGMDADPVEAGSSCKTALDQPTGSMADLYEVLGALMQDDSGAMELEVAIQPTTGIIEEIAMYDRGVDRWHIIEVVTDFDVDEVCVD